jgi:hypothetical protein
MPFHKRRGICHAPFCDQVEQPQVIADVAAHALMVRVGTVGEQPPDGIYPLQSIDVEGIPLDWEYFADNRNAMIERFEREVSAKRVGEMPRSEHGARCR